MQKKMKNKKKYHTVGTVPKSHRKIIEMCNIDTSSTQLHDRSFSWIFTATSIKSGGVNLSWLYRYELNLY